MNMCFFEPEHVEVGENRRNRCAHCCANKLEKELSEVLKHIMLENKQKQATEYRNKLRPEVGMFLKNISDDPHTALDGDGWVE